MGPKSQNGCFGYAFLKDGVGTLCEFVKFLAPKLRSFQTNFAVHEQTPALPPLRVHAILCIIELWLEIERHH